MKKKLLFLVCFSMLAFTLMGSADVSSHPVNENATVVSYTLDEMRLIALNALKLDFYMEADCGSWDEVIIVKETPLFDIDGNITSY